MMTLHSLSILQFLSTADQLKAFTLIQLFEHYPVNLSFGFITFIAAKCAATSVAKLCQDFPPKSGPIFSKACITLGANSRQR